MADFEREEDFPAIENDHLIQEPSKATIMDLHSNDVISEAFKDFKAKNDEPKSILAEAKKMIENLSTQDSQNQEQKFSYKENFDQKTTDSIENSERQSKELEWGSMHFKKFSRSRV